MRHTFHSTCPTHPLFAFYELNKHLIMQNCRTIPRFIACALYYAIAVRSIILQIERSLSISRFFKGRGLTHEICMIWVVFGRWRVQILLDHLFLACFHSEPKVGLENNTTFFMPLLVQSETTAKKYDPIYIWRVTGQIPPILCNFHVLTLGLWKNAILTRIVRSGEC